MFEKIFKLKENNTNVKTEVVAGFTTFMTMAYILAVNPNILSASGMSSEAVVLSTALAAFIGTLCMAFFANYPFALAPGMGLNAYFAYTVCLTYGYSWKFALFAIVVEGIIFILLSATKVREAIFNSIPMNLKYAVSAGIGLFIAFIGLQNAKIVINNDSTLLGLAVFKTGGAANVGAIIAIIGVIITGILLAKNVKGGILYGIIITWVIGIIAEVTGIYVPNPEIGMYSTIPASIVSFNFSAIGETFGQAFSREALAGFKIVDFVVIMFAFLFVDMFDTLGTLIGCAAKGNMLDENGKLPRIKGALFSDAVATVVGGILGTSTTTTYVESASGVTAGGRTGLTALTTGLLFLVSIIFWPLFVTIPSFATAPALIIVGFYMIGQVRHIDFDDIGEGVPAFLTIAFMPLAYSISEGICAGVISWTLINLITGKAKEKKISIVMYILTILFILKYCFI